MKPISLRDTVADHPWSSAKDALLLGALMLGAVLLAFEYDLLYFAREMPAAQHELTLAEMMLLTALLVIFIGTFVVRRRIEVRRDHAQQSELELEIKELRRQATHDPLTGLPNRRAVLAALEAVTAPGSNCGRHAFFLLDLDDFKRVNDRCGHAVGDQVLQQVVERLRAATRATDLLARLGGDEFAVLSYDVSEAAALAIGHRFIASLHSPIRVEDETHKLGISVGAALIPEDGTTSAQIIRNADEAMYCAKAAGRTPLVFYKEMVNAAAPGDRRARS